MKHLLSLLVECEGLLDAPAASAHVTAILSQSPHVTLVQITHAKEVSHSPVSDADDSPLESQRIAGTV